MLIAHLLSGVLLGVASLPHCALMCGPLAANVCSSAPSSGNAMARTAGSYLIARLVGYATLGAVLATLGAPLLQRVPVRWSEALVAALMGVYLCWAALRLARRPAPKLVDLRTTKPIEQRVAVPAWLVGTATALLPCGALWGAYVVAGVSGNASAGAATMVGFSLASAPALAMGVGFSGLLRRIQRPFAPKLLSSAIFAGALIMIWRAYSALQQTGDSCCVG